MTQDYIDEMAEIFLDRYFDLGDDEQTLKENIRVAGQLLLSSEKEVKEIAGFVENGEVFDESAAILSVQNFCFAQRFLKIFQDKLKNLEKLRAASMG